MTDKVTIIPHNEVYFKIKCESGILQELSEYFTFYIPNYKYTPQYKKGLWDGKIRLLNKRQGLLYVGLEKHVQEFCDERGYELISPFAADEFSENVALEFIKALKVPEKYENRDYQIDTFVHCIRERRALFVSPTACHSKDDLILTSIGWKKVQDIKIGDIIYGSDGNKKTVLKTFKGIDNLYDIIPRNNRQKITVTKDHILSLKFTDKKEKYGYCKGNLEYIENITVESYLQKSKYYKHCSVLYYNSIPIKFNEKVDSLLTPYFIGCYIGDGSSYRCELTNNDIEVINEVYNQAKLLNCIVQQKGIHYQITGTTGKYNSVFYQFSKYKLHFSGKNRIKCSERFIPNEFKYSSIDFRKEILAGLIDTDGYLNSTKTYFEFTSKSEQLSKDVKEIAISLGLIATIKPKFNKKYSRYYYRVIICGNIHIIPTRIKRKIAPKKEKQRNTYVCSFDIIQKEEKGEYYGFEVEDHLYITNDGMITHNSGKSYMIYLIARWYQEIHSLKTLLIVPSTNLIKQMTGDFIEYGYSENKIHQIYSGQEHYSHCPIVISTWQSLMKEDEAFFSQFGVVIVDEAHGAKANEVKEILHKMPNCKYRFGFTGSLDGTLTHKMVLEGLFGAHKQIATTKELMDKGYLASMMIKCIQFCYEEQLKKVLKKADYDTEIKWLETFEPRNKAIVNLALSLEGNVLILYQHIDMHGIPLYEMTKEHVGNRPLYIIHGRIDDDDVESIRKIVNTHETSITYASISKFSKGVNIPNIDYIILPSPTKSRINIMQSIGRGLRKSETKKQLVVFDIADDLVYKKWKNYTYTHFEKRLQYYCEEQFDYKLYKVLLK